MITIQRHAPSISAMNIGVLLLIAALALPGLASGQRMRGARNNANPRVDPTKDILVRFSGTLRNVDKKKLELEIDGEQSLSFYVNKKTAYFAGKQQAKSGESLVGTIVTIEARREFNKDLIAVNVIAEQPKTDVDPGLKQRP